MQLIGQAIRHETFGPGVVTGWDRNILTVCFSTGDKKFLYPDAFSKFLTLRNRTMQDQIQGILETRRAEKAAEQLARQEEQERKSRLLSLKPSPKSHAVFHIPSAQERDLFSVWSVSTGTYLSGLSKGAPRIPDRLKPNSLCLLTSCGHSIQEQERRVIGAFMVEEDFFGNACRSGMVTAHPAYRIALKPEKRPAFWPYLTEDPAKRRWGNTAFQYFSLKTAERILFDLLELLDMPQEREAASRFYRYFCQINRIPVRNSAEDGSIPD